MRVEKEGGERGQEGRARDRREDEGKKGSDSRCDKRKLGNRVTSDKRKKRGRKERNNRESDRRKVDEFDLEKNQEELLCGSD